MHYTGIINTFNDFKGFGFIRRDKGKDAYFSIDDFTNEVDIDSIIIGTEVTFDIVKTKKGPKAFNIIQL
ncbi:hypothetical protein BCU84_13625 [Shewanella sp. 10N.286.51.B7]|uniref:retron Se72 family effector protein n=1 Tax=Shewanella sp. 10N.286.51.B7 TaxID=1880836 RepID=UPI000C8438C3|nr:retron Se72 family effector protein [Shewanella sp. 10N.286.51.B7]PMG76367.1 hypothetical protein BCU84_13625 [Shewanella sp. 10N.286.51.B7]